MSWPKRLRLRKRPEFLAVQQGGRKFVLPRFLCFTLPVTDRPTARFGLAVSRKIGNSVVRNRVKRLYREALRRHQSLFGPMDVVLIARSRATIPTLTEVDADVRRLASMLEVRP